MNVKEFNYSLLDELGVIIKERKVREEGKKRATKTVSDVYVNEIITFDIETTNLKKLNGKDFRQAFMYIFAIQVGDNITIYGRTWEEFRYFIEKASEAIGKKKLVIYVHNLSFEFSFLAGIFNFDSEKVFATKAHHVLRAELNNIEFRCSLFLTNLSLDKFTAQMGVENKKLSGSKFDYSKIRYPWTPLTEYELAYMTNDVKGLEQALKKKLELTGDDLTTVPLTATGYVRRDVKNVIDKGLRLDIVKIFPFKELYLLLREAFRGGNTMANRYIAGDILDDVTSFDMISSYPNVLLTENYPISQFRKESLPFNEAKINKLLKNKKAFIGRFGFGNLRLKNPDCPYPYISRFKCRELNTIDPNKSTIWNGRVLRADFLETTLTDIDYAIIKELYTWDSSYCFDLYSAYYGPLPEKIKNVIRKYYEEKTRLKGVEEGDELYPYYMANKEMLNACYGMLVEDPCKNKAVFEEGDYVQELPDSIEACLHKAKWSKLPYQWGVWCSAYGRKNLQAGLNLVGEDFVYCDTDSVKFVGEHDFSKLNALAEYKSTYNNAIAPNKDGEVKYMGVWEKEKGYDKPNRFCTLGAKKYVVEAPYKDEKTGKTEQKLHLTISGVKKRKEDEEGNMHEAGEELGQIENFKAGFIFKEFGKPITVHNLNVDITIEVEGHELKVTDNCYLEEGTYKLSDADYLGDFYDMEAFEDFLDEIEEIKYLDINLPGIYEHIANIEE